jgi:hypothetical protein
LILGNVSAGDITSVVSSNGDLTGGSTSGAVDLAINYTRINNTIDARATGGTGFTNGTDINVRNINVTNSYIDKYNILFYGAKGDGNTDDTQSIKNAIESIPENSTLYFPPLVYNVTNRAYPTLWGSIHINKSINIDAKGATFIGTQSITNNDEYVFVIENTKNVNINGIYISFRGNSAGGGAFWIRNSSNINLDNNIITNHAPFKFGAYGYYIEHSNNVFINNFIINNVSLYGITWDGSIIDGEISTGSYQINDTVYNLFISNGEINSVRRGINYNTLNRTFKNIYISNLYINNSDYGIVLNKITDSFFNNIYIENMNYDGITLNRHNNNLFFNNIIIKNVKNDGFVLYENDKISLTKVNPEDWNFKYQELHKTLTEWCNGGGTVGSYFYKFFYDESTPQSEKIERIRNNVVNREWYENEFDKIWELQYKCNAHKDTGVWRSVRMTSHASTLDARVLVLNRLYGAIRIIDAARAFSLLFRELAEVINVEDGSYMNYTFNTWSEVSVLQREYECEQHDWVDRKSVV